jgi:DNA-directed RNA polymerase subunit RPC12/RpoP
MDKDQDELICNNCEESFFESDFDDIDDEYSEDDNLCPHCSEQKSLQGVTCEHCDEPAVVYYGSTPLCEEHLEEYRDALNED